MPKRSTILQAVVLLVVVLCCMDGHYSKCPPTSPVERAQILKTLGKHEKELSRDAVNLWHAKIRQCGKTAWVRYSVSYPCSQLAVWPVEVKLSKSGGQWEVVSEKDNQPWWWHVVNRTIGVK
ncbi:MAG: hypothetical protein ACYS32_10035 [Planctomycetota bacterium]